MRSLRPSLPPKRGRPLPWVAPEKWPCGLGEAKKQKRKQNPKVQLSKIFQFSYCSKFVEETRIFKRASAISENEEVRKLNRNAAIHALNQRSRFPRFASLTNL